MNCPSCGKPVLPTQKTCRCGAVLAAAAGPPQPAYLSQGQPSPAGQGFYLLGGVPSQNFGNTPNLAGGTKKLTDTARLRIREYGMEREFSLSGATLTIGRDPAVANFLVGQPNSSSQYGLLGISRQHARLTFQNGVYSIEDLQSANGTFLRGQRLFPAQLVALRNGDVIRIGAGGGNSVSILFNDDNASLSAQSMTLDPAKLQAPQVSIGRDQANGLCLPSPMVSAVHAYIRRDTAGRHELIDNHSTNGTFVNGRRISRVWLKADDTLQIGPYKLSYSGAQNGLIHASRHIRLDGIRIFKQVWDKDKRENKVLLDNVSLSILPGEFVALVGGSGAGKSTLMDALNGSRPANRGNILINGQDLYEAFDANRTNMGYVPQNDILHLNLSVKNALWYTAMLRLPADFGKSAAQRVKEVIKMVELDGKESVRIDRLSGGQRKRVSIASELLSDPSLLFLDEPTSGLDPGLDKKMMDTLNLLADGGRTVLLTTHATNNILDTCDQVAFMSHGHLTYYGPPRQAMDFFHANNDFATIYNMVEKPDQAMQKEMEYKQTSPDYQTYIVGRQNNIPLPGGHSRRQHQGHLDVLSSIRQFFVLTIRYLDLIFHDTFSMIVLLAAMPIIGIILNTIAEKTALTGQGTDFDKILRDAPMYNPGGDAQKLLFMVSLSVILFGLFAAAYEVIKEKTVYQRERMINLEIIPYVLSKIFVLGAFGIFQVAVLLFILSQKVDFPKFEIDYLLFLPTEVEIYMTLALAMLASICLGLAISAMVKSRDAVIYIILVLLIVQIVFAGALFTLPGPMGELVSVLTPTRWSLETLGAVIDVNTLSEQSHVKVKDNGNEYIRSMYIDLGIQYAGKTTDNEGSLKPDYEGKSLDEIQDMKHWERRFALLRGWFVLFMFTLFFAGATMFLLKKQDVR